MSDSSRKPAKTAKRAPLKPSLTCAICKRRYRPLQTQGMQTIYSICPDCRLDVKREAAED